MEERITRKQAVGFWLTTLAKFPNFVHCFKKACANRNGGTAHMVKKVPFKNEILVQRSLTCLNCTQWAECCKRTAAFVADLIEPSDMAPIVERLDFHFYSPRRFYIRFFERAENYTDQDEQPANPIEVTYNLELEQEELAV